MTEIKFEIPEELEFMENVPKIDWSLFAQKIIKSKMEEIKKLKSSLSNSELTEEQVNELTDEINNSLSQKYIKG